MPTVFAGQRKIKDKNIYNMSVPCKASQVLSTFDIMTENEMGFMSEWDRDENIPENTGSI